VVARIKSRDIKLLIPR